MTAKTILCRAQQAAVGLGGRFLRWPRPVCITGPGSLRRLPALLREAGVKKPLIVASRRQLADPSFAAVAEGLGEYVTFSDVPANPPVETVEAVAALYRRSGCDGFVAIGGGSPMDAAKAAAARIARPDRTVAQMGGLMKVGRTIPPFIAVPTTAGTGSETTMAAVVTGADHHKYALGDLHLIPRYAILDPALTVSLPPDITAQTGMDALTHAVEAYCNRFYNTNRTRRLAEEAAADIFRYLPIACANGEDPEAREKLLLASFQAGCAFTRAGVGNVHAIAHTLGGLYGVGHGLANAVLLPVVLRDYGAAVTPRLSRLAQCAGIRGGAAGFVDAIFAMNEKLGIPRGFSCIREEDIPRMTAWADAEANPAYPVPVIYDRARFAQIIRQIRQE